MITLSSKGTILGVTKKNPTYKELQICPYVTCSSSLELDPHNFLFPKILRTVEEDISRKIGVVMTKGQYTDLANTESDINSVYQIYDIGDMTGQIIGSVKVASIPSRNVSKTKVTVKDMSQKKAF